MRYSMNDNVISVQQSGTTETMEEDGIRKQAADDSDRCDKLEEYHTSI